MARQQYKVAPYIKHLEVFNDFSGGLNTVTTNDKLRNNELPNITNLDLGDRGSLKRRDGMVKHYGQDVQPEKNSWTHFGSKKWSELQ